MTPKFTKVDVVEAIHVLTTITAALLATSSNSGVPGASLNYAVSALNQRAETSIRGAQIAAPFADCFSLARLAGATYKQMLNVVTIAQTMSPAGMPAKVVSTLAVRYGLAQIARLLALTKFTSRDDVDQAIASTNSMFEDAATYAADNSDIAAYAALISLHAAVSNDLTTRSRPLPKMIAYSYGRTFSALSLAHRLYGDAARALELVQENKVFNPAFMPRVGQALSA